MDAQFNGASDAGELPEAESQNLSLSNASEDTTIQNSNTENARDNRRHDILLQVVLNMVIHIKVLKNIEMARATLVTMSNMMHMFGTLITTRHMRVVGETWRVKRNNPFADLNLLSSHSEKEFRRRCRVKRSTFLYICALVAPAMQKGNRGGGIPLENRVAMSLNRLGTGNYLLGCADLFGMSESLACIVVRQFCQAVLDYIRPLVVPKFTLENRRNVAAKFEAKHGLPYIMGAIDGSHIPIIAPPDDPFPFYNRKGFYSAVLQGIVDADTIFLDWDFGWAGSLHDYTVFQHSAEGRKLMAGWYHPYKFIGDAAYPFRTHMYVPFKGGKDSLSAAHAHWNFIQSSTRMAVERAFGILKGRWCILLRRLEMNLENVTPVVGACICLHNLCIMHKDFAEEGLLEESKRWLHEQHIDSFGDLKQAGTMRILDYGKHEVSRLAIDVDDLIAKGNAYVEEEGSPPDEYDAADLGAGVTMHKRIADTLFKRHLSKSVDLPEEILDEEDESSSGEE